MIEYHKLYLPTLKKEVKIEVSIPRDYPKLNTSFDTLYLLDGQNAFKDSHASFHRSIRASKYMGMIASSIHKRIIGVAIYNAGSDMGRINEYTPFKITNAAEKEWEKQDPKICNAFCKDLVNVIIPYIDKIYPTIPTQEHRFIYGSSLAAITALYLSYQFPHTFGTAGLFSPASFLCPKTIESFIKKNIDTKVRIFLYVGKKEVSDGSYDETLYYNSCLELFNLLTKLNASTRLVVSENGTHCEASWEKHLLDFFSFIYFDQIIYRG